MGAQAQILNDSTQTVYSPKTTHVLREETIFRGEYEPRLIDTTLNNLQQTRNWYHDTTFYQDLGNLATPAKRLFFTLPRQIGARYGRTIFDRYNYEPAQQVYFDSKSPYTRFNYVQGGNGQQVFDGTFSRNINQNASAGFTYERISSEKFYAATNRRPQVERTGLTLFTHFQTKENRYHLFANINYAEHSNLESGGIRPSADDNGSLDSLYEEDLSALSVYLTTVTNNEYRHNIHVSQVLRVAKEHLKVFHTFDYRKQFNRYEDNALDYADDPATTSNRLVIQYYPMAKYDTLRTWQAGRYRALENTLGIMSDSKLHFFRGYVKQRNFKYQSMVTDVLQSSATDTLPEQINFERDTTQLFVGGTAEFKFRDVFNVSATGEYQLFKDYRLEAAVRLKFLTVAQTRVSYSPTYTEQNLVSNHYEWHNTNFRNTVADRTAVRLDGHLFHNTVNLEVARTNLQDYIYYNEKAVPVQTSAQLQLYTASLHHHLNLRFFHIDNILHYTDNSQAEVIRVPQWVINSKVYFQGSLFRNALFGQVGAEVLLQDDFYADRYMPATQQFFIQDISELSKSKFLVPSYPLVDVFVTADIKSFSIFAKMAHVNQGFPRNGYFTTPIYLGQPRNFTFGIRWMFFD